MKESDDIANLFRHFGGQPGQYQEISRANEARQSRERWPLLASIEADQAAQRPPVDVAIHQDAPQAQAPQPAIPPVAVQPVAPPPDPEPAPQPAAPHGVGGIAMRGRGSGVRPGLAVHVLPASCQVGIHAGEIVHFLFRLAGDIVIDFDHQAFSPSEGVSRRLGDVRGALLVGRAAEAVTLAPGGWHVVAVVDGHDVVLAKGPDRRRFGTSRLCVVYSMNVPPSPLVPAPRRFRPRSSPPA
ncbi:hypothetical protein E2I20_25675 [Alcaligenaceae bacterium SAGV3]|nr:hypothetical protein [Alcaligenaceae bacterium SAGV3]